MDKKRLKRLETKLRQKIEAVFAAGTFMNKGHLIGTELDGSIDHESFGVCLLGAVTFGKDRHREDGFDFFAAKLLGISFEDANRLETGYMCPYDVHNNPLKQLGARLRRDYCGDHQ